VSTKWGGFASAGAAERRVLRWVLVVFFAMAIVVVVATAWRKSRSCEAACALRDQGAGSLRLSGGGRLGMQVECLCAVRPALGPASRAAP